MLMTIFLLGITLELGVYVWPLALGRLVRKALAAGAMISVGFGSGVLLASSLNVFVLLIAIISGYRVINLLRVVSGRLPEMYLWHACSRTSLLLIIGQGLLAGLWLTWQSLGLGAGAALTWLSIAQLVAASGILIFAARSALKTRHRQSDLALADTELPSVTIAIPARNETDDLEDCLRAALKSDYPKLEVLVLDDCSQDNTPDIIRTFAHDGVRFIPGQDPKANWLAKNQAYERLYEHASGEYILFCGVDIRLGSQAVRSLVGTAVHRNKRMVSVLPKRYDARIQSAFVQPARYWWEMALPRRLFNRPPALSSCWLIEKNALKKAGGFAAVSRSITPEAYFARELIKEDAYSFMRSSADLDVQTAKPFARQLETAVRTSYPKLRRRPENVMVLSITELVFLLGPFMLTFSALWIPYGPFHSLAIASCLLLIAAHSLVITSTDPGNWWLALINLPIVIAIDLVISQQSMWRYEFSEVHWKGRGICLPVMRAVPHLPKAP